MLALADSNAFEPRFYERVRELTGPVDAVFIGMECEGAPLSWAFGPYLSKPPPRKMDQSRRFNGSNCASALEVVRIFTPRQVYVYAMGQEPWITFLTSIKYREDSVPIVESNKLVTECKKRGLVAERLYGCRELQLG